MNQESLKIIKELSEAFGPSGFEGEVRQVMRKYMPEGVKTADDQMGNLICEKRGQADSPRIMVNAHMDELGLFITNIDAGGFLKVHPLGGMWSQTTADKKWIVRGKKGKVPGVTYALDPHLVPDGFKKQLEMKDVFIDVGAEDRKHAVETIGVDIGDLAVPDMELFQMANKDIICGKAFDDRLGCALMVELMRWLAAHPHRNTVFAAGSVQEEVGMRGIIAAVNSVKPDAAIILDIVPALDHPGCKHEEWPENKIGKGPTIHLLDAGSILNRSFVHLAEEIAKRLKIKLQYWASASASNDARAVQYHNKGVPTLVMGVPFRYFHGHIGMFHAEDYVRCFQILTELVTGLDAKGIKRLKPNE